MGRRFQRVRVAGTDGKGNLQIDPPSLANLPISANGFIICSERKAHAMCLLNTASPRAGFSIYESLLGRIYGNLFSWYNA